MVERQLSGISSSVAPTEPDDLPSDSQVLDSHPGWPYELEGSCENGDTQTMESEKLDEVFTTPRPVARPLQATNPEQSQAKAIVLDDDEQPQVADLDRRRAQRIAELKAQILELESMKGELETSAGWGPGLFSVSCLWHAFASA